MFALRRTAAQSATTIRAAAARSTAKFSSSASSRAAHEAHAHAAPKDEHLGLGYYFFIGTFPAAYVLYKLSRPAEDGKKPVLERIIDRYTEVESFWATRNKLHTSMIEQAAFDRNLFQSDYKSTHVPLRFPETFNSGSPYNVVAGQGSRGIETLVAHYEKLNNEAEEKKIQALKA